MDPRTFLPPRPAHAGDLPDLEGAAASVSTGP
jgi:hypothetical protein